MGQLGCGRHQVLLAERGGDPIIELPYESLRWGRRLDDMSDASITVPTVGLSDEECCWAISIMQAWEHELVIHRDGTLVWAGPLAEPSFTMDSATVPARDLFAWMERRVLPVDRAFDLVDLGTIFQTYVDDVLAVENSMGLIVAASTVGVIGSRSVLATELRRAADELRELARSGIDWTMVGRTMQVGGEEVPVSTLPPITADLLTDVKATVRGLSAATHVFVVGSAGADAGEPIVGEAGGTDATFGLLQSVFSESSIEDSNSARYAAINHLDLLELPPLYIEGDLDPSVAIGIDELIPGALVDVVMDVGCRRVDETFRLLTVDVSDGVGGETVHVSFAPAGTRSLGS